MSTTTSTVYKTQTSGDTTGTLGLEKCNTDGCTKVSNCTLDSWTWIWFFVSVALLVLFIAIMIFYQRALAEAVNPESMPGGSSSIDFGVKMNSVGNAFRTETVSDLNEALTNCLNASDCNAFSWNDDTKEMLIITSADDTSESTVYTTFWR